MRFYHYQLCSLPEDEVKYGSIGLFMKISHFFVLLCFVLALGFQASGSYYRSFIREDLSDFQPLKCKGMAFFSPSWNTC